MWGGAVSSLLVYDSYCRSYPRDLKRYDGLKLGVIKTNMRVKKEWCGRGAVSTLIVYDPYLESYPRVFVS